MTDYVKIDRELIETWGEHGIPFDRSTVEYATKLIGRMATIIETQDRTIMELVDGVGTLYVKCSACEGRGDRYDDDAPWGMCSVCNSCGMVPVWSKDTG